MGNEWELQRGCWYWGLVCGIVWNEAELKCVEFGSFG